ncbi:hypothetical protein AF53_02878 [Serratia marcescens BIDMC 80]|nr:hypothetical protein AM470_19585 [Serratia marcescens]AVN48765.1 hypothetical protein AM478_02920 [Serratia marcescens]EZQ69992.1 hypothetical protein AF53_02878 [Serratia marcescens BIDMC 80]RLO42259.1 hypothetical protein CLM68_16835 [Serratia marcescens]
MRIKSLVHWIFDIIPDFLFDQLSKPTFAETDGVAQTQMLSNVEEIGEANVFKESTKGIKHGSK